MCYAPGLAWVKYNRKLAFHLRDMIHSTIFPATQLVPRSIIIPIMICIDEMHASVNKHTHMHLQLLKDKQHVVE